MKKQFDEARIIGLYEKYKTLQRTALSADCSPTTVKKILVKNGIELNTYKAPRLHIGSLKY
ncbi:hypothetical protein [Clostridium magnum]|nr:hypothetical protein [Clostridium magnum]